MFGRYGFGIDIYYIVLVLPAFLIALIAQMKVQTTFNRLRTKDIQSGYDGYYAARNILDTNGLYDVAIELSNGRLSDHYDPKRRVISLSNDVYSGRSAVALGVAAHEVGHALQYQTEYFPIKIRSAMIPVTNIGSTLSMPLILIGYLMNLIGFIYLGIALFSLVTIFQLLTLPVEYDASRRAMVSLSNLKILNATELIDAKKVLSAAALTYVASLLVSFMSLLRMLFIVSSGRKKR